MTDVSRYYSYAELQQQNAALTQQLSALRASAAQKELMADSYSGLLAEGQLAREFIERLAEAPPAYVDASRILRCGFCSSAYANRIDPEPHSVTCLHRQAVYYLATATATGAEEAQ